MKKLRRNKDVVLLTTLALFGSMPFAVEAADSPWTSSNRIAISADGNPDADADDIGATPFTLAVLAKAGLQDNLVHYDFNNFLEYKKIDAANNNMWIGAMGGQSRWGFDASRFHDAGIDPDGAVAHLTAEINKSTAGDPLYLIAAGPMELTYRALKAADASAIQYVTIVSHHQYNEYFKSRLWLRNWNDIQNEFPSIGYIRIADQNGATGTGLKGTADSDFSWLQSHADPNLNWVYDRIVVGKPDVSDAGMLCWLIGINGSDEKVTIAEMETWFGADLIDTNGGTSTAPAAPAGVEPAVVLPNPSQIFEEVDGKIVIQAESVPLTDNWKLLTTDASYVTTTPNYSGDGYIRWEPSWMGEISQQHQGALLYKLRITNPGNYRMALHSSHYGAPARDQWNDCWTVMGLNPVNPYGITRKTYHSINNDQFNAGTDFSWQTTHNNYGAVAGTDGEFSAPLYNLTAGDHYFWICGRSGGFRIDKIHFFLEGVDGFKSDAEPDTPIIAVAPAKMVYLATNDFPTITGGEVPYYLDTSRNALAINAGTTSYRDKFARAETTFEGPDGTYYVDLTTLTEIDGEGTYRLLVNGSVVATFTNPRVDAAGDMQPNIHRWSNIALSNGDAIAIESNTASNGLIPEGDAFAWARGRWRQLEVIAQPPVLVEVSAGDDQAVLMPVTEAQLAGAASVNEGSIASTLWSQKSGPTTVVFANANQLSTTVAGVIPGTYVFTLTAEDEAGNVGSDEVSIEFTGSKIIQSDDFSSFSGNINGDDWNPKWSGGTDQQRLCDGNDGMLTLETTVAAENYHVVAKQPFSLDVGQKAVMASDFRYAHMAGGEATQELNKSAFALMLSPADNWWTVTKKCFNICNRGSGIGTQDTTGSDVIAHSSLGVNTTTGGTSDWFRIEWTIERGDVNYIGTATILNSSGTVLYTGTPMGLGFANGSTLYGGYSTGGDGSNTYTTNVASYSRISMVQMDNFEVEVSSANMTPIYKDVSEAIDFVAPEGFSTAGLNGQRGWVSAADWSVSTTGDGTASCSGLNKNMTYGQGFQLSKEGDTLDYTVRYTVQGTHVPTGWKYLARIGVTSDLSSANRGYDADGTSLINAMVTIQEHASVSNSYRIYGDGWDGPFTDALASSAGDVFEAHYTLTLGADAASTEFSVELKNVTHPASQGPITEDDGIGEGLYNAILSGEAYVYFETGGLGDGITGVVVDSVEVDYAWMLVDSFPGWINTYGIIGAAADLTYDVDGDGLSNIEEYIAGTDPDDRASKFMIHTRTDGNGDVVADWACLEGRAYDVLMSTNLTSGTFIPVKTDMEFPNNSFTSDVSHAESDACYYKVEVRIP